MTVNSGHPVSIEFLIRIERCGARDVWAVELLHSRRRKQRELILRAGRRGTGIGREFPESDSSSDTLGKMTSLFEDGESRESVEAFLKRRSSHEDSFSDVLVSPIAYSVGLVVEIVALGDLKILFPSEMFAYDASRER